MPWPSASKHQGRVPLSLENATIRNRTLRRDPHGWPYSAPHPFSLPEVEVSAARLRLNSSAVRSILASLAMLRMEQQIDTVAHHLCATCTSTTPRSHGRGWPPQRRETSATVTGRARTALRA